MSAQAGSGACVAARAAFGVGTGASAACRCLRSRVRPAPRGEAVSDRTLQLAAGWGRRNPRRSPRGDHSREPFNFLPWRRQ